MKILIITALSLITLAAHSQEFKIFDILTPSKNSDHFLVLTTNGKVFNVLESDEQTLDKVYSAWHSNLSVYLTDTEALPIINEEDNFRKTIYEVTPVNFAYTKGFRNWWRRVRGRPTTSNDANSRPEPRPKPRPSNRKPVDPMSNYTPTVVESMDEAQRLLDGMRQDIKNGSQCYNRAHIWGYELDKTANIKSKKIWIFFSRKYIEEFEFQWWFHVTPIIEVKGQEENIIMDRMFVSSPKTQSFWKNIWMKNKAECVKMDRYSTFGVGVSEDWCYTMISNMYFWQPHQLEALENGGKVIKGWDQEQIDIAYGDAFTGEALN